MHFTQCLCRRRLAPAAQSLTRLLQWTPAVLALAEVATATETRDVFRAWCGNAHACAALAAALRQDDAAALMQLEALASSGEHTPGRGFARIACARLARASAIRGALTYRGEIWTQMSDAPASAQ